MDVFIFKEQLKKLEISSWYWWVLILQFMIASVVGFSLENIMSWWGFNGNIMHVITFRTLGLTQEVGFN
jgi:hypothetical protein